MARELTTGSLTRGQLNAVRAASKAGITPTQIARQFGLSQSDVRKALSSKTFDSTWKRLNLKCGANDENLSTNEHALSPGRVVFSQSKALA
jgi:hypothetical protein